MPSIGQRADGVADLAPYEDKLKVISHSTKWWDGVADLIRYKEKLKDVEGDIWFNGIALCKQVEGNILYNVAVRGGGGFGSLWG